MRALLPALLLSAAISGCYLAPQHTAPAVGSRRAFTLCFGTSQGAIVFRDAWAKCPEPDSVEAILRKTEEIYGVSLAGSRIYVQQGWVECEASGMRGGCASGHSPYGDLTVTDGVTLYGSMQHEANHVGHMRSGAAGPWMDPDLRGDFFQEINAHSRANGRGE